MPTKPNKSLLVIGECMMELSGDGDSYHRAYAGDTYNSAVYAKRRYDDIDVQMLTAVGADSISEAMLAQWDRDGVGHCLVMTSEYAHPGIYAISTDDEGERSFTYWRTDSAATELMSLLNDHIRQKLEQFNYIYFSGISLAILSDEDKAEFLALIADLKNQGKTIAFDPNYRQALWDDLEHAKLWLTQAYRLTDIALPGLSDHKEIFGNDNSEEVRACLEEIGVREIIVKGESEGVFGYAKGQTPVHMTIVPEQHPLDTTGAGDSFAGTYLAERLTGTSMMDALRSAAKVASLVVQHRGAIVDEKIYREFIDKDS